MEMSEVSPGRVTLLPDSSRLTQVAAVLPRLYLGVIFGVAALAKIAAPAGFAKALAGYLSGVALAQGFGWYQELVRTIILPHAGLFAILVVVGEVFVSIAMLLGFATRTASVIAVFLLVNYMSSKGIPPWAPASNDMADIVLATVVGLTRAKDLFGLDAILLNRRTASQAHEP